MIWYAWVLVICCAINIAATIAIIGKPREPITPPVALVVAVVNVLMIWAIVSLAVK